MLLCCVIAICYNFCHSYISVASFQTICFKCNYAWDFFFHLFFLTLDYMSCRILLNKLGPELNFSFYPHLPYRLHPNINKMLFTGRFTMIKNITKDRPLCNESCMWDQNYLSYLGTLSWKKYRYKIFVSDSWPSLISLHYLQWTLFSS